MSFPVRSNYPVNGPLVDRRLESSNKGDVAGHEFHGNQWHEGQLAQHADENGKVKIVGNVAGAGKTGTLHSVAQSGHFAGVRDAKGNHLGYFHESNLRRIE